MALSLARSFRRRKKNPSQAVPQAAVMAMAKAEGRLVPGKDTWLKLTLRVPRDADSGQAPCGAPSSTQAQGLPLPAQPAPRLGR